MAVKVTLPQMGEGVVEATVTKWLKREGDEVKEYDPLVEVNTDKVDTEIPSPVSGTVLKIVAVEGNAAPVNSILAWIGKPGEAIPGGEAGAPPAPVAETKPAPKPATVQPAPVIAAQPVPAAKPVPATIPRPVQPQTNGSTSGTAVSPLVARIAAENKVNLAAVRGSGPGGRVTKEDVLSYMQSGGAAARIWLPSFRRS
jgi:pyruvate dehydrogenase E2 component (dihydrolipoamide acetyltransferase)